MYSQRREKYNKYAKTCFLFEQQDLTKKHDKMSSFSGTGSVLYNAPERRENKKVKIIVKFNIKIYNET